MGKFLDWYSAHNTIIIQSLAVLIALLIIFFIFRLFFSKQAAEATSSHSGEFSYDLLEEKLNKLLEQHAQMKVVSTSTEGGGELTAQQVAEMAQLKTEITELKDSLGKKEAELLSAKEQASSAPSSNDQLNDLNNKLSEYEKQISKLNSRLSEYEIIAEDIADLQKYKNENDQLKKQVAEASQAPKAAPTPAPVPEPVAPVAAAAPTPAPAAPAPAAAPAAPAPAVAPAASGGSLSLQQDEIDKLLNNFSADVPAEAPAVSAAPGEQVSADEAESLDDFEKNFQKG